MNVFSSFFALIMLSAGFAVTISLRGYQFKRLPAAIRTALAAEKKRGASSVHEKKSASGELTPFQAMASALGGSIGTANIAGTASAIAIGGPGAVFYMWLAALFGMAVKFSEIVLAVRFREKRGSEWYGGPMLYIEKGLGGSNAGHLSRALARCFALFALLSSCVGTPLVQANTIAMSALDAVRVFCPDANEVAVKSISSLALAAVVGAVVLGGARRIGRLSELLVPFMALGYMVVCTAVLFRFRSAVLPSLASIFKGAVGIRPIAGGLGGYSVSAALRVGTARGVYSNEAGVGSAPMAHALANTKSPVKQGLYGIFEVFADTLVMCSMTALVVLASGAALPRTGSVSGTSIALSAFSSVLGSGAAGVFLAVSLLLFAFTSIIGWSVYGLACAKYLFGAGARLPYCLGFTLLTALGAFVRVDFVWKCGEMLNYLMAAPNMLALLLLLPVVKKEIALFE